MRTAGGWGWCVANMAFPGLNAAVLVRAYMHMYVCLCLCLHCTLGGRTYYCVIAEEVVRHQHVEALEFWAR